MAGEELAYLLVLVGQQWGRAGVKRVRQGLAALCPSCYRGPARRPAMFHHPQPTP